MGTWRRGAGHCAAGAAEEEEEGEARGRPAVDPSAGAATAELVLPPGTLVEKVGRPGSPGVVTEMSSPRARLMIRSAILAMASEANSQHAVKTSTESSVLYTNVGPRTQTQRVRRAESRRTSCCTVCGMV